MIRIRSLTEDDLDFADQVREIAGWNQLRADWERYLTLEPEGCFLAEVDGKPAGTATTTCYGTDLAWIGMALVHPDFRRRGVGTALLKRAIRYLREERGIRCVKLDATPEGRPLYEKLGFRPEWGLKRWLREEAGDGGEVSCESPGMLNEKAYRLDREVFGADRVALLKLLRKDAVVAAGSEDGSLGLARDGARAIYLGPITASCSEQGAAIAREMIGALPQNRGIFWDFPDANLAAVDLAKSLDFEPVRELTRMWLGETANQSDPRRMFGISDFGLG